MNCISCGGKAFALLPMKNRSYGVCKGCSSAIKVYPERFA